MNASEAPCDQRALISTTSILILSSYLIGMTTSKIVGEELMPYVLAAGLVGFMAYVCFEMANYRRIQLTFQRDLGSLQAHLKEHVRNFGGTHLPEGSKSDLKRPAQPLQSFDRNEYHPLSTF